MKKTITIAPVFYVFVATSTLVTACQKNGDTALQTTSSTTSTTTDASSTIAVVASATQANSDSVYIVQPCPRGMHRDSTSQADLPAAVATYLNTNYAGYTFNKAFAIKDTSGTVSSYVVVVYYNDKPVALQFDSAGLFLRVLEQREGGDLQGAGFHHGGRFQHRDGKGRDSVSLSNLPASILTYFSANYSSDTVLKAYKNCDSSYVVLSKNGSLFATVFDAAGSFVKRIPLALKVAGTRDSTQAVDQATLPAAITTYLTTSYPAYVFEKAFVLKEDATVKGYVVLLDANNTKYAVAFDAAGTFLAVKTIY